MIDFANVKEINCQASLSSITHDNIDRPVAAIMAHSLEPTLRIARSSKQTSRHVRQKGNSLL